mmetsp:Transcript_20617/g.23829  ORF Transcript_20617/g.23829 Transcript_20617/m.23829 type:complete len:165 (+) Transcript_20617:3719-4213(+)
MNDNFEVDLPEIAHIQQLLDACNNWRTKAKAILSARSIYLLNYDYSLVQKTYEEIYRLEHPYEAKKRTLKNTDKHCEEATDSKSEGTRKREAFFRDLNVSSPLSFSHLSVKFFGDSAIKRIKVCEEAEAEVSKSEHKTSDRSNEVYKIINDSQIFEYNNVYCIC